MNRHKILAVTLVSLALSGRAWSIESARIDQFGGGTNTRESASLFFIDTPLSSSYQAGELFALRVWPLGGSVQSATIVYFNASANTQVAYVVPRNATNVQAKLSLGTAAGPSTTNYARVGWTASTTGSAPTGGTEEAYFHFQPVFRDTPGTWPGFVTPQGGATLYVTVGGGQTPAQSGANGIVVTYTTP